MADSLPPLALMLLLLAGLSGFNLRVKVTADHKGLRTWSLSVKARKRR